MITGGRFEERLCRCPVFHSQCRSETLWRYFFKFIWKAMRSKLKVASWAGFVRLDNTRLRFTHSAEAHFGNCKVTRSI